MRNNLVGTIFQSASTDRIKVVDPTSVDNNGTISNPSPAMKGVLNKVVDNIKPAVGAAKDIAQLIQFVKNNPINKKALLERALGAMGTNFPSLLSQVGAKAQAMFNLPSLDVIDGVIGKGYEIYSEGKEMYDFFTSDSLNAGAVFDMVKGMTGGEELLSFIDVQAEVAAVAGILNTVVESGMPELIDDVLTLTQSERVMRESMGWLSTRAIANGSLDVLSKTVDVAGRLSIIENNPDFSKEVVKNFKLFDAPVEKWGEVGNLLKDTLDIVEPTWNKTVDGFYKLGGYLGGSDDFNKVMCATSEVDRMMVMTATAYEKVSNEPIAILKSMYKDIFVPDDTVALTKETSVNQRTVNPFMLPKFNHPSDQSISVM